MNVFLRKMLLFSVFLLPLVAGAQDVEVTTYWNGTMEYQFTSTRYAPTIRVSPIHGELNIVSLGDDQYLVQYTPTPFYVGSDFIQIKAWEVNPFPRLTDLNLNIEVIPAEIRSRS